MMEWNEEEFGPRPRPRFVPPYTPGNKLGILLGLVIVLLVLVVEECAGAQTVTVPAAPAADSLIDGVRGIPVPAGTPLGILADAVLHQGRQLAELRTQVLLLAVAVFTLAILVLVPRRYWRRRLGGAPRPQEPPRA